MPVVSLPVAGVCALSQYLAMFSSYAFSVPASLVLPVASKHLGRFVFLTFQSNLFLMGYYTVSVATHVRSMPGLEQALVTLHPLAFGLGTFLTASHYALNHFNPKQVERRAYFQENGYPMVNLDVHLEHGFAAPGIVFFTMNLNLLSTSLAAPTTTAIYRYVGGYLGYYLAQTHVNRWVTGEWPYPFIDSIEKASGWLGTTSMFAGLTGLFFALGFAGKAVFGYRQCTLIKTSKTS